MGKNTVFEILPIKPSFSFKEIKKAKNRLILLYHTDKIIHKNITPEELKIKLTEKYNNITKLINSTFMDIEKDQAVYTESDYNRYLRFYKKILKNYTEDQLKIILKANKLETNGSREKLEEIIIENVPSEIAKLNLDEHNLREKYVSDIKDTLKNFPENKLIRILELKGIAAIGDPLSLINQIASNINEDEIKTLIKKTDEEINNLKAKLFKLNEKQLTLILDNNNLNSYGAKSQLITKIIETLPISEIQNNIDKVSIGYEKALKKLYSITGKENLSNSFKKRLTDNYLSTEDGIKIRKELITLIKNYQIKEKDIEPKITELINKKAQKIINDTLNNLYTITGEKSINKSFLNRLRRSGLDKNDGIKIKNEIIMDIKSKKVKKEDLTEIINLKIKERKARKQDEKINAIYKITGKTTLKSTFKKLLLKHDLTESDGLKIRNEILRIVKTSKIDKNKINPKIQELITLTSAKKLLNTCTLSYLSQIAMINNLSPCDTKKEYINYFLNNISHSFNDLKIKSDIDKINIIKEKLDKLYKNQLEDILISNNIFSKGIKNELIDIIISKIPIKNIEIIISEFDKITEKLEQLTLNELSFILKENNIKVKGTKTKVINEINKTLPIITIDNYINQINGIELKLKELNTNELKFIAEINNLSIKDDDHYLIEEIGTKLDFEIILRSISEISNIKKNVNRFNKLQREHLLIINDLDVSDDNKSQINTILENIELLKIDKFTKMLDDLKEELSNLNIIQLDYILTKHNLEKAADKSIQIDTILENIRIPFIKKDIQTIKSLQNTINTISEDEINSILEEYKLKKSIDKKENFKTIVENLSLNEINECLSKNKTNITSIDTIKDSELICPVKISNGKKIITTTKHENSIFLLLFDNENSFNEYKKDNSFVKKLKKDLDYFKKLINKNKKIKGIIIKKTPEDLIIEKDQL